MIVLVDYATVSAFDSTRDTASLAMATNVRRPVRFCGIVRKHLFPLRIALRALGEAIWSNDSWRELSDILDPVITVHPDRIFFEAFSQDQSVYACLIVDRDVFAVESEVITGTTNIDFTAWLWGALGEMRSSRQTTFRVGAEGLEVKTAGAGGRFEKKVDLPDTWVRGFLQVQAAMGLPGTRFTAQPIDLLAALRYLRYTKARVSPRALRYEFEPGEPVRLVLEPWEHSVILEGADHNYSEKKTTRVWGRRRMKLIEGLLPFAESVDIYLKGRALPSFYAVKLPGMTFVLGMTGFSAAGFTGTGGFDLLAAAAENNDHHLELTLPLLRERYHVSIDEVAAALNISPAAASQALVRLCRRGQCMFDVETRRYRHRELFERPIDEAKYFPPDLRAENAARILSDGGVTVRSCVAEETTKVKKLKTPTGKVERAITYRDWRVIGAVDRLEPVEIVLDDTGRVIFGRCPCPFFDEHLLNQGPCEHMLALYQASRPHCTDGPTSSAADASPVRKEPSRWEVDSGGSAEDNDSADEEESEEA